MSNANKADEITLDELSRLIRMLGMLGSDHEGEVLAAARFAVRWVREKGTDWETLLTPEPEQGVTGVGTALGQQEASEAAIPQAREASYNKGYADGLRAMAAQVRAQAAAMQAGNFQAAINAQANANQQGSAANSGPGYTIHTSPPPPSAAQNAPPQPPQPHWSLPGATNPHAAPSWKFVAWELLSRDAQGMPGVFRGSREQDFVASLLLRGWPNLTQAQDNWLRDIAGRSGMTW